MQSNKESRASTQRERKAMREANSLPGSSIVDVDPEDPSQFLDEADGYSIVDIGVDAQPSAEADAELDAAVAVATGEGEDPGVELDTPSQTTADAYAEAADDTGELYGVHVPTLADRNLDVNPDGESFQDSALGENFMETLEKKAAEIGAEPEKELDVVDNSDTERHHSTERRDRPVADKGAGGSGGL